MSTVSKVLNGRAGVSDRSASASRGCCIPPATVGGERRTTQGKLIELVFDNIDSEWSLQIIRGVDASRSDNGLERHPDRER